MAWNSGSCLVLFSVVVLDDEIGSKCAPKMIPIVPPIADIIREQKIDSRKFVGFPWMVSIADVMKNEAVPSVNENSAPKPSALCNLFMVFSVKKVGKKVVERKPKVTCNEELSLRRLRVSIKRDHKLDGFFCLGWQIK